jgi:hypothetical protein
MKDVGVEFIDFKCQHRTTCGGMKLGPFPGAKHDYSLEEAVVDRRDLGDGINAHPDSSHLRLSKEEHTLVCG